MFENIRISHEVRRMHLAVIFHCVDTTMDTKYRSHDKRTYFLELNLKQYFSAR